MMKVKGWTQGVFKCSTQYIPAVEQNKAASPVSLLPMKSRISLPAPVMVGNSHTFFYPVGKVMEKLASSTCGAG